MKRRYVSETHACVFTLTSPAKLGRRARAILTRVEAGRDDAWVPAAVVAELLILRGLGRLRVGLPQLRTAWEENPGFHFLPLDLDQLDQRSVLESIRDPFDRLGVSAARSLGAKLITRDARLSQGGQVETIWT